MIKRKPAEITKYVICNALGYEEGHDISTRGANNGFQTKYNWYGLTEKEHFYNGNELTFLSIPYQIWVQAIGGTFGFKQKLIFASNKVFKNIYVAEDVGARREAYNW